MRAKSEFHEDVNEEDIYHSTFKDNPDDYSFEIEDICSLFDDPMDTPLFDLVKQFILKNPDVGFDLTYEMSWDNSLIRIILMMIVMTMMKMMKMKKTMMISENRVIQHM